MILVFYELFKQEWRHVVIEHINVDLKHLKNKYERDVIVYRRYSNLLIN